MTPGRFSSRASAAQSGSARRRMPVVAPARPNSRCSSASSVTSSASGHVSPAAVDALQIVLDRRARRSQTPPDLARAHAIVVEPQ